MAIKEGPFMRILKEFEWFWSTPVNIFTADYSAADFNGRVEEVYYVLNNRYLKGLFEYELDACDTPDNYSIKGLVEDQYVVFPSDEAKKTITETYGSVFGSPNSLVTIYYWKDNRCDFPNVFLFADVVAYVYAAEIDSDGNRTGLYDPIHSVQLVGQRFDIETTEGAIETHQIIAAGPGTPSEVDAVKAGWPKMSEGASVDFDTLDNNSVVIHPDILTKVVY